MTLVISGTVSLWFVARSNPWSSETHQAYCPANISRTITVPKNINAGQKRSHHQSRSQKWTGLKIFQLLLFSTVFSRINGKGGTEFAAPGRIIPRVMGKTPRHFDPANAFVIVSRTNQFDAEIMSQTLSQSGLLEAHIGQIQGMVCLLKRGLRVIPPTDPVCPDARRTWLPSGLRPATIRTVFELPGSTWS